MKKLFYLFLILALTSFKDDYKKQRYWLGTCIMEDGNYKYFNPAVVRADNLNQAKSLFNNYIKNDPQLSKSKFVGTGTTAYNVTEILEKNILK